MIAVNTTNAGSSLAHWFLVSANGGEHGGEHARRLVYLVEPFRTARVGSGWRKGNSRLRYIVCLYTTLGFVHMRYICQKVYSRSI